MKKLLKATVCTLAVFAAFSVFVMPDISCNNNNYVSISPHHHESLY